MNKNGSVIDIIIFMVMAFVIVMFFALWVYGFNLVSTTMDTMDQGIGDTTIAEISQKTIGQVNSAQQTWLPILATVLIFGMILTIFMSNFLIRIHPAFFLVYLLVIIGAVITSAYISNQYEDLMTNEIIGETLQSWTMPSFFMLWLPYIVTAVGIFGSIIVFAGILRDEGLGGGV